MSAGLFANGNARVTRLVILEMAAGIVTLVLINVIATLPAQDWMTPHALKITSFVLGTVLSIIKGMEMFFSKTSSLYKQHPDADVPASGIVTTIGTVTTTTETKTENK